MQPIYRSAAVLSGVYLCCVYKSVVLFRLFVGGVFILKEGWVLSTDRKKLMAQELLRKKSRELGRTPRKEDFDEVTRSRIKAFLGPWPRALEAAGLKEKKK